MSITRESLLIDIPVGRTFFYSAREVLGSILGLQKTESCIIVHFQSGLITIKETFTKKVYN